jgi:phosphoketolase
VKSVHRLNLTNFLAAARKARPNEKAVKVDTKLVDAFFADVAVTEKDNAALLAAKDAEVIRLQRELSDAQSKLAALSPPANAE